MSEVKIIRPEAGAAFSIEPWKDDVTFFAFNPVEDIMSQEDGSLVFPSCRNARHAGKRSRQVPCPARNSLQLRDSLRWHPPSRPCDSLHVESVPHRRTQPASSCILHFSRLFMLFHLKRENNVERCISPYCHLQKSEQIQYSNFRHVRLQSCRSENFSFLFLSCCAPQPYKIPLVSLTCAIRRSTLRTTLYLWGYRLFQPLLA